MSSPWIQHVKQYQSQHGGSYRDAMQNSRSSYQSQSGGKFSIKKTIKRINKGAHKANHLVNQYGDLVPGEYAKELKQAQNIINHTQELSGGKFNIKKVGKRLKKGSKKLNHNISQVNGAIDKYSNFVPDEYQGDMRKLKNTLNRVDDVNNQVSDELNGGRFNFKHAMRKAGHTVNKVKKYARVAAPILDVVAPEFGVPLTAALMATGGILVSKKNTYLLNGGSFKVRGGSYITHGGKMFKLSDSQSSLISTSHPSFNPPPPSTVKQRIKNN